MMDAVYSIDLYENFRTYSWCREMWNILSLHNKAVSNLSANPPTQFLTASVPVLYKNEFKTLFVLCQFVREYFFFILRQQTLEIFIVRWGNGIIVFLPLN